MMTILWIAVVLLVLVGIAGTVLPALPGAPLVFLGLLLAAWADGFQRVGWVPLAVLAFLTILTFVVEVVVTGHGARRTGASGKAVLGATVGTVVGIFFGIPGLIAGPFIGAVAGEFLASRDLARAGKAGVGTWLGLAFGVAAKVALVFTMIGIFIAAYLL